MGWGSFSHTVKHENVRAVTGADVLLFLFVSQLRRMI